MTLDPRDTDPLYTPEDVLWDPVARKFVRRPGLGGLVFALAVTAVFWLAVGFFAGRASAAGPSAPAPEPSFVPVPGATIRGGGSFDATATVQPTIVLATPSAADASSTLGATASPTPRPTPKPTPRPKPAPVVRGPVIRGTASWYDDGPGLYAAVHSWRWGDRRYNLRVCAGSRCVIVTVRDFCGCPGGRVIDLSRSAFARLAPLSAGLVKVTVAR